jgi:hypothetical protein
LVPTDKGWSHEWWCRYQHGLDLGTLWEEEGFDWCKEARNMFENHPAFQTCQKINKTKRKGNLTRDQTVDGVELLRDLCKLMCCIFENKCFTFVAVDRDIL